MELPGRRSPRRCDVTLKKLKSSYLVASLAMDDEYPEAQSRITMGHHACSLMTASTYHEWITENE
jgi:hypothetical protein